MLSRSLRLHVNVCSLIIYIRKQHGPVVRTLGLHAAAPGSNLVRTSGLDLYPVVSDSTLRTMLCK